MRSHYLKKEKDSNYKTFQSVVLAGVTDVKHLKSTVELAFTNAMKIMEEEGYVKGPKKLGCFGASYLYSIFIRIGIVSDKREGVKWHLRMP